MARGRKRKAAASVGLSAFFTFRFLTWIFGLGSDAEN